MGKDIPLKNRDLEKRCNANIKEYGYKNQLGDEETKEEQRGMEETYRTNLRRQRDKILYTGGFRRLQDKTQVMSATLMGDHRTRLTHTLEVEQISTSIANALKLNVDLASAISLGHDIGHTPFGHAAERELNELLKDRGGFHHPIQSVRYLWEKYGDRIDVEIYKGILSHDSDMFTIKKEDAQKQLQYISKGKEVPFKDFFGEFPTTLEAQVVIWADKIAYITHDLEDFLSSSIYMEIVKYEKSQGEKKVQTKLKKILTELIEKDVKDIEEFELRDLIRNLTTNLIQSSATNINKISEDNNNNFVQKSVQYQTEKRHPNGEENNRNQYLDSLIINFKDEYRTHYYELRRFMDQYYIFSPEVQRSDAKARVIVKHLFETFTENYKLLPLIIRKDIDQAIEHQIEEEKILERYIKPEFTSDVDDIIKQIKNNNDIKKFQEIKNAIIWRKVACYISTMTDTYAENLYCNLTGSRDNYVL